MSRPCQKFVLGAPTSVTAVVAEATPAAFVTLALGVHIRVVLPFTVEMLPLDCVEGDGHHRLPAGVGRHRHRGIEVTVPKP